MIDPRILFGYQNLIDNKSEEFIRELYDELYLRAINLDQWISKDKLTSPFNPMFEKYSLEHLYQIGLYQALLFGHDNRSEVINFCNPELRDQLLMISKSVAGVVKTEKLNYQPGPNRYNLMNHAPTLKQRFLRKGLRLIDKTPFLLQPSIMSGTAFLVGKDLVLTAGHVIEDRDVRNDSIGLSFIFGFKYDKYHNIDSNSFLNFNIYEGKQILYKVNDESGDWAIIKLNREVSEYQEIAPIHFDFEYSNGYNISGIGHPMGLPMKYTNDAIITRIGKNFIDTSLDTFWGNSGSPILAIKEGKFGVIGIMSSTSGRYVPASDHCKLYRPQQFYKNKNLYMRCQKINSTINQHINN